MQDEPKSLKSLFAEADKKRLAIERTHPGAYPSYHDDLSAAIQCYQTCLEQIGQLSLFSPNESADDISTSDLPYLLTDHHLADLIQRTPTTTPSDRTRVLAATRAAHERFLHLLDSYALLSPPHARLLSRYADDPAAFTTAPAGADPAARRDAKIAAFRDEKDLRQRLDFLRSQPAYADPDARAGGDEEAVRAVHLAHLAHAAHLTFQGLESLNRELDVLALAPPPAPPGSGAGAPSADGDARRRRPAGADEYSERLDGPMGGAAGVRGGPLLSREGKPLRPFTLVGGGRQELARGVFRPGHNLPTMSIDEYLEEERRRGGIIEGGGEASMRVPEPDEDDFDKADAETMKAREWDEFKEANPRGSGNTLNRG